MTDIQSNIRVNIDTSGALDSIKNLQRQISVFQKQMQSSSAANAATAQDLQRSLIGDINATKKFAASIQTIKSSTESFTSSLEKNKLSMGEYFRYSLSASKTFGKSFSTELSTIEKVARERVKTLQTQYISLGRDASGALNAVSVRPLTLDLNDLGTQQAITAQKTQIFNQLLKQGSTNLLNFGKNTQWAGRQLMVGFTIPLSIFGSTAAKAFMDLEEQTIKFKRVYGDLMTPSAETDKMIGQVKELASEFTKYGVAVKDTMGLASEAAAMGKQGADLTAQVAEATRLSVLGNVSQSQALETSISLTNAFGVATDKLSSKVDFLNAVENQTVTSIEDLTTAIPKAGPVVKQLGGSVEDLAFFLTAMKEGGIDASEGANALKSGLASLINPTAKASAMLQNYGIDIKGIVANNAGDVSATVVDFAKALDTLNPVDRARAIEQLFGKFQFARLSTLFQNVIKDGSQAAKVLDLMQASTAELAALSNKELKAVEESTTYKFKAAIEEFQAALAPIGEEFMKLVTPLIKFGTSILDVFNNMGDTAKGFITGTIAVLGGLAPVALMTFGLVANGVANLLKSFGFLRNVFMGLGNSTGVLGEQLTYLTEDQLRAEAVAASLEQTHARLPQIFTSEAAAIDQLTAAYDRANASAARFQARPIATNIGGGVGVKKMASGGFVSGAGSGTSDSIPAMLSNGEAVIPANMAKRYAPLIAGIIAGSIPGFATGTVSVGGNGYATRGGSEAPILAFISQLESAGADMSTITAMLDKIVEANGKLTKKSVAAAAAAENLQTKKQDSDGLVRMHLADRVTQGYEGTGRVGLTGVTMGATKKLNDSVKGEMAFADFAGEWNKVRSGTGLKTAAQKGKGEKLTEEEIKALATLTDEIRDDAIARAKARGASGVNEVKDLFPAAAAAFEKAASQNGAMGSMGKAMLNRYEVSSERTVPIAEEIKKAFASGAVIQKGNGTALVDAVSGQEVARVESSVRDLLNLAKTQEERIKIIADAQFRSSSNNIPGKKGYVGEGISSQLADQLDEESQSASPSKKMKKAAKNMVDGVEQGIAEGEKQVEQATAKAIETGRRRGGRGTSAGQTTVGTGPMSWTKDTKSGNVFTSQKMAQQEATRAVAINRVSEKAMAGLSGMTNKVMGLSSALSSATFLASAFGLNLGAVGDAVFQVSNLLLMLAVTTKAVIASEKAKAIANAATGALDMIATKGGVKGAGRLIKGLVSGEATGKFAAAKNVFANLGTVATKAVAPLGAFGGVVLKIGSFLIKGLPIIGALFTAFQIGKAIFDKAQADIQGLGDTANLSAEKMKQAGDLLGFQAKTIDFKGSFGGSAAGTGSAQQSQIDQLRGNSDFKDQFSTQINAVKNASKDQAELALKSLSIQMAASGAPKEAVDTMVKALAAEAGKTNLDLSFTKIDFSTKEGLAEATNVAKDAAAMFNSSFQQNYNPGAWFGIQNAAMSTASETVSAQFTSLFQGLKAGFESGTLSAEEFNTQLALISGQLGSMNSAQLAMILPGILEGLDMKDSVKGLDNVYDQLLMVKAAAAGVKIDPKDMEAFVAASKKDATPEQLSKVIKLRRKYNVLITETTSKQEDANNAAAIMTQQQEDIASATQSLDEQIATLQAQVEVHQTLIDMGYSEAEAQAIASNAMWATALAAAAAQDKIDGVTTGFTGMLEKMKTVQALDLKVGKFSSGGKADESPYEKAINQLKEQRTELYNTAAAYKKLTSNGVNAASAFSAAKDPILAAAIATTKVGTKAWTKLVALIKAANNEAAKGAIKDLLIEMKNTSTLEKSFAPLIPILSKIGLTADEIQSILDDPTMLQAFVSGIKKGKIVSQEVLDIIKQFGIDREVKIKLKVTPEGLKEQFDELYNNAMAQFDNEEKGVDIKYAGQIKAATDAVTAAEKAVASVQDEIDGLQTSVDKKQREIELTIDRPIEAINQQISDLERQIETQYNRPIANLQEESSDLSNDLTLIDKQAESINKTYDEQKSNLEKQAAANSRILEQDKGRLSISNALASGSASAAAAAMQEEAAREAEVAKQKATDALEAARANKIAALRSASGMSREQIEARQFAIGQQIYHLEEQKEEKAKSILKLQDDIYAIELKRQPLLNDIRVVEDSIYGITTGRLKTAQDALKARQDELAVIENNKKADVDAINLKRDAWNNAAYAADAAKFAVNDYNAQLKTALGLVEDIKKAWAAVGTADVADVTGKIPAPTVTKNPSTNNNSGNGGGGGTTQIHKDGTSAGIGFVWKKDKKVAVQKPGIYVAGQEWTWDATSASWKLTKYVPKPPADELSKYKAELKKIADHKYVTLWEKNDALNNIKAFEKKWGTQYKAKGGMIMPAMFASGGLALGTDTVPAMLTPGEFVMTKSAVQNFGTDKLKAINSGSYNGESVYNYSVNVNVQTGADANRIAQEVMTQIKRIDSQRIRGNRFNG